MYFYIPQFVLGILVTLLAEILALIIVLARLNARQNEVEEINIKKVNKDDTFN